MKETFCKECGIALAPGIAFCSSCGTPISKITPSSTANPVHPVRTKEPVPKKRKVLLGSIAALFILLISTHFTLLYLTNSTKQLTNIYNAILDENGNAFFAQLTVADDLVYDKNSYTKNFNTPTFTTLYDELSDVVERVKVTGLTGVVKDDSGIETFRIKREKLLFFYSKVSIEPISQKLSINTDLENTTLIIAGDSFELTGKPITLNKVLPDDYTVTLKGKNTYFESEGTSEIERSSFSDGAELKLFAANYSLKLAGSPAESTVYVNGKSTNKMIKDFAAVGPIFGKSTTFHAVREVSEGKIEESDKVTGGPGETITFSFPLLVKVQADVKQKEIEAKQNAQKNAQQAKEDTAMIRVASIDYSNFRDAYENALNYQEFSYIQPYLYASGKAYNELRKFISETDNTYYFYNFITNEVKSGSVEGNKVRLQVLEVFTFENHLGQTTRYERKKEYLFIEVSPENYELIEINIKDTNKDKY